MFVTSPRRCGWESRCRFGVAGVALRLRAGRRPLGIPDLIAAGVHAKGLQVSDARGETLYRHLILRDGRLTRVAYLFCAGAGPEAFRSGFRQPTVLKLLANKKTGCVSVHLRLAGIAPAGSGRGREDNFWCAPLDIPDLEAGDVELNGLLFLRPIAERRGDALHHQLLLGDELVARIAHLSIRRTTPESRHAVERQTTVLELFANEYTKRVVFHW